VFPQVQVTVASTYSGWISVFMMHSSVDAAAHPLAETHVKV
jgi:hypothetical protein